MYNILCMAIFLIFRGLFWEASKSLMVSHFVRINFIGMKQSVINEFPSHGISIERTIDDCIHSKSHYVLLWIFLLFDFNYLDLNEVQQFLVSLFDFSFNFEFLSCIYEYYLPSQCLSYDTFDLVIMFQFSFIYCVLWIFWHIVLCPKWYNDVLFSDKTKTFCRRFSDIIIFTLYFSGLM